MKIKVLYNDLNLLLFFAFTTCTFIFNYNDETFLGIPAYLWVNILIVAFMGWTFINVIRSGGIIKWNKLFGYPILFTLLCFFSCLYSYAPIQTFDRFRRMVIMFALMLCIYQYVSENEKNLVNALRAFAWGGLISAAYLFFNTDSLTSRIGSAIGDANLVGITFAFTVTVSIHLLKTEHRKIYLIHITVISLAILLTGSRTSAGLLLAAIIGNIYLSAYQNKWKLRYIIFSTVGVIAILILFLYAVMNIPLLYDTLGMRIQSFWQIIHGQESVYNESSTQTRGIFAKRAFEWFLESPLLGHGINTFPTYNNTFQDGWFCFSHCDYVEILSGLGILGLASFFFPFIIMIRHMFKKQMSIQKRNYSILMASLSIEFLLGEIFLVMYYEKTTWILFALLSAMYSIIKKENI